LESLHPHPAPLPCLPQAGIQGEGGEWRKVVNKTKKPIPYLEMGINSPPDHIPTLSMVKGLKDILKWPLSLIKIIKLRPKSQHQKVFLRGKVDYQDQI
jgi:hypothetical protein